MHNSESVEENGTHKLLCDFKIQTDHLIFARRTDVEIVTKKEPTEYWAKLSRQTTE